MATDAGGIRALRHGTVRARVAGVARRCWPTARSSTARGLLKDNAGYDLPALLVGSEGTLGDHHRRALAAGAAARPAASPRSIAARVARQARPLLADVRPRLPSLDAAEFLLDDGPGARARPPRPARAACPTRAPAYVLLECAAPADPTEELAEALGAGGDRGRGRGRRQRRARAAVALARGATPRRSRPRACRTSWTSACRWRGWPSSPRACRGGRAPGARGAHDPLRPPRRRQRPRQRARASSPRTTPSTRRCSSSRPRAAARSAPSTASAWPRRAGSGSCARPGELARDGARSSARSTPTGSSTRACCCRDPLVDERELVDHRRGQHERVEVVAAHAAVERVEREVSGSQSASRPSKSARASGAGSRGRRDVTP